MGCRPRVVVVIRQVTNMVKMVHQLSKAEFSWKVSKFLRYLEVNGWNFVKYTIIMVIMVTPSQCCHAPAWTNTRHITVNLSKKYGK